jgi:hypothetical protein
MKNRKFVLTGLMAILSLILGGCEFPFNTAEEQLSISETMVALAFTQTAMVESDTEEILETEALTNIPTDAPPTDPNLTDTPEILHEITPGEPGYISKWFYDTDSSDNQNAGGVTGGDDYVANLFERPFTRGEMVYRPDIDIVKTEIKHDDNFIYTNIFMSGEHPSGGLPGTYGVEIDWDRDGRGDLLVLAQSPNLNDWDISGVSIHKDTNNDVGGRNIMRPDPNYQGDSYDQEFFSMNVLDDPDAAWSRWQSNAQPVVTIAFKRSLLSGNNTFVWGVWASEDLLTSANLDLHDRFTQSEAGSPYPNRSNYPLSQINLVDNTCRETFGFEPSSPIPGLCYTPEAATPTPEEPGERPIPTEPTHDELPGTVVYTAFDDLDNDGNHDVGEPYTVYDITVTAHNDSCANPVVKSSMAKFDNLSELGPGMICVKITQPGPMTTPSQYIVEIVPGGSASVIFGFESPE